MKKCFKIVLEGTFPEGFLFNFIKKYASEFDLEGTAQLTAEHTARIIICGAPDNLDQFADFLHKNAPTEQITVALLEPFLKDKEYRGVFRIIE